jgi:hypothetical protein
MCTRKVVDRFIDAHALASSVGSAIYFANSPSHKTPDAAADELAKPLHAERKGGEGHKESMGRWALIGIGSTTGAGGFRG